MLKTLVFTLFLIVPVAALAQEAPDPWKAFRFLEGTWTGTGEGLSGTSTVTQSYEFILGGKFLKITTRSEFPPQEKNPEGEMHEDLSIVSYDTGTKSHIMRAFYVEGFVNTYRLASVSTEGSLTFITTDIENAPPTTKARLILRRLSDNEMEESFWVAFPGQKNTCLVTNRLKKQ